MRVLEAITALGADPRPKGSIQLKGGNGERRIRVGNHRIVYEINDMAVTVLVLYVRDRKDAYK